MRMSRPVILRSDAWACRMASSITDLPTLRLDQMGDVMDVFDWVIVLRPDRMSLLKVLVNAAIRAPGEHLTATTDARTAILRWD